jgi:hypothetical protein
VATAIKYREQLGNVIAHGSPAEMNGLIRHEAQGKSELRNA